MAATACPGRHRDARDATRTGGAAECAQPWAEPPWTKTLRKTTTRAKRAAAEIEIVAWERVAPALRQASTTPVINSARATPIARLIAPRLEINPPAPRGRNSAGSRLA